MHWTGERDTHGEILRPCLTPPATDGHKYDRGHGFIVSGPRHRTGAARLAANACLRVGAGLVTILGEDDALDEHASHVTAIMLRSIRDLDIIDRRAGAVAIGPGLGIGDTTRALVVDLLARTAGICGAVLDADALTSFAEHPQRLFAMLRPDCVLTPHGGEFARLFPNIALDHRAAAARRAAEQAGCVVLLKGAETVIAAPDGRLGVNRHASPWLATAGAGDVLTGLIAGLLSQRVEPFDAACIAAWLHGAAGIRGGAGLIADDLPGLVREVMGDLVI